MKEQFTPTPVEMEKIQEDAWKINQEVDDVYPIRQKYETMQKTAKLVIEKQRLLEEFRGEWSEAIKNLPDGVKPAMPINEKAVANMYIAGHLFEKKINTKHIVQCLVNGKEVTDKIKSPQVGSRYFKLELPDGTGMPGRFVIPNESGTELAEHIADWNQNGDIKVRHGKKCFVIKKSDIPRWMIELESSIYVIVQKNEIPNSNPPKYEAADGPTIDDPEGDWLISTAHYGDPSNRKPRPPKEPRWNEMPKDPAVALEEIIKYQKSVADYTKKIDSWTDEQERVVFVDLEEEGVGQKGFRQESRINDPNVAELVHDNEDLRKMLNNAIGEINILKSEIKGIKTKMDKNKK